MKGWKPAAAAGLAALLLCLLLTGVCWGWTTGEGWLDDYLEQLGAEQGPPVVGTQENLKRLLNSLEYGETTVGGRWEESAPVLKAAPSAAGDANQASPDFSRTNVQVAGVDEADTVKTDGTNIYQINGQRVLIIRAWPADELQVLQSIDFRREDFTPRELFVDDRFLVVVGSSAAGYPVAKTELPTAKIMPPRPSSAAVKAIIYALQKGGDVRRLREVEIEGDYLATRKIGTTVYLLTRKSLYYYGGEPDQPPIPFYRDSQVSDDRQALSLQNIYYFPTARGPNYLLTAAVDLAADRPAEVKAYLGSGETIYASAHSLYVAVTRQVFAITAPLLRRWPEGSAENTRLYRFRLEPGSITYAARGQVPGRVLNQFSMDEAGGYFRLATTSGNSWGEMPGSRNNVYVLDNELRLIGQLEDLAPGEQIYSARFIGSRCYLVTFRTVDPLYVIDLADVNQPRVLGALKIPGYSNYLHPYDDDHLIGIGKQTVEVANKDWQGRETGTSAYYLGMKLALFDVSDVAHPVEVAVATIGDRGTESEVLQNHRALLFDRQQELLALPITLRENRAETGTPIFPDPVPPYGQFSFQGLYVYRLSLEQGFQLAGRITHLTADDYLKAGEYWFNQERAVERALYIGDVLFTLSRAELQAHRLADLQPLATLPLNVN